MKSPEWYTYPTKQHLDWGAIGKTVEWLIGLAVIWFFVKLIFFGL